MIDLSIIIVNYNKRDMLRDCLLSIKDKVCDVEYEIIVVDNNSVDNSVDTVINEFPEVVLIANDQNKGFSVANNQGAGIAKGRFLFFLNNDTKLLSSDMKSVLDYFYNSNAGMIGLGLLNQDMTPQRQGGVLGAKFWNKRKTQKVSFVIGAAFLMPKELFAELGGFDENYVFFNEDLDLCKRVIKTRYDVVYYPVFEVLHYGGVANRYLSEFSIIEGYRGGLYFCKKHYGLLLKIYKPLVCLDLIFRIIQMQIRGLYDKENEKVAVMKRAYQKTLRLVISYE